MATVLLGHQVQPFTPKYILENHSYELNPNDRYDICCYDNIYYYGRNHLAYRYKLADICGEGSYGKVYNALDMKTGETCVIKISKPQYNQVALDEIKMLNKIKSCDIFGNSNLVKIVDNFNQVIIGGKLNPN